MPSDYPMKPPNIVLLTPNGRFETHRKICLSISGYHPETWRPSWSIRTALLAIVGFMPTPGMGAIGSLDLPAEDRKRLAVNSRSYVCDICGSIGDKLLPITEASNSLSKEADEAASMLSVTGEKETSKQQKQPVTNNNDLSASTKPPDPPVDSSLNQTTATSTTTSSVNCTPSVVASTSSSNGLQPTASTINNTSQSTFYNPWLSNGLLSSVPNATTSYSHQPAYWVCYPVYANEPSPPPLFGAGAAVNGGDATAASQGGQSNTTKPLSFIDWLRQQRRANASGDNSATANIVSRSPPPPSDQQVSSSRSPSPRTSPEPIAGSTPSLKEQKPISDSVASTASSILPSAPPPSPVSKISEDQAVEDKSEQPSTSVSPVKEKNADGQQPTSSKTALDQKKSDSDPWENIPKLPAQSGAVERKTPAPTAASTTNTSTFATSSCPPPPSGSRQSREAPLDNYYKTAAAVCAIGVAVALIIVVVRRLTYMFDAM